MLRCFLHHIQCVHLAHLLTFSFSYVLHDSLSFVLFLTQGMKVGGKRTLRIPPNLAYGDQWFKGTIPPKSHLEFDLELIKVAQNPGEELLMQLQAFGVGRALGFVACIILFAVAPMLG
mmetsp:Transcript_16143/g.30740  ORF Transcript_16143/g.30740 Transcript_16143/m.30740 type:complete len:118 (+) Transcript_16143:208-561(+)